MKPIHFCSSCWLILFMQWMVSGSAVSGQNQSHNERYWNDVFSGNRVVKISIKITQENWEKMQPGRGRGDYTYVPVTMQADSETLDQAGIRFKGNSSYRFSAGSLKRPLKVDTNRFVKGLKLHGKSKFNLSNSFLDPSFMKEKLAYDLYRQAGLAAPRVGWADVTLEFEGENTKHPLGVYVLIEQVDDKLLKSQLGKESRDSLLMKPEVRSWTYPGDDPANYSVYNIKSGEEETALILRFGELLKLIESADDDEFRQHIAKLMDLDGLASYLAVTSLLANLDSFVAAPHNYYLVVDKSDRRVKLLPWDVNEAFGTFTFGRDPEQLVQWSITRPWVGNQRFLERLFQMNGFREKYFAKIRELVAGEFSEKAVFAKIARYEKVLLPTIEKAGLQELFGFQMGIDGDANGINAAVGRRIYAIKPFVRKRLDFVKKELAKLETSEASSGR